MDDTLSNEDDKEANICLMEDKTSKRSESDQDSKVNLDDLESLRKAYHELWSNSSILSKAYRILCRDLKNLSKDHLKLKKTLQDKEYGSMDESV